MNEALNQIKTSVKSSHKNCYKSNMRKYKKKIKNNTILIKLWINMLRETNKYMHCGKYKNEHITNRKSNNVIKQNSHKWNGLRNRISQS